MESKVEPKILSNLRKKEVPRRFSIKILNLAGMSAKTSCGLEKEISRKRRFRKDVIPERVIRANIRLEIRYRRLLPVFMAATLRKMVTTTYIKPERVILT